MIRVICYSFYPPRSDALFSNDFEDLLILGKAFVFLHVSLSLLQELNTLFSDLYSAYQHFIGQPHFDALLELLSYQDVAMLLKELMEILRNLVYHSLTYRCFEFFRIAFESETGTVHRYQTTMMLVFTALQ